MFRLIGPHQGMRLERIRAETDDQLEEIERRFKYKLEDDQKESEAEVQEGKAQFYDKIDQTPLVEQAEELIEDKEKDSEVGLGPQMNAEPTHVDENGRQWYYDGNETHWWRDTSLNEWQLLVTEASQSE